jgi:hypothetical protein
MKRKEKRKKMRKMKRKEKRKKMRKMKRKNCLPTPPKQIPSLFLSKTMPSWQPP